MSPPIVRDGLRYEFDAVAKARVTVNGTPNRAGRAAERQPSALHPVASEAGFPDLVLKSEYRLVYVPRKFFSTAVILPSVATALSA